MSSNAGLPAHANLALTLSLFHGPVRGALGVSHGPGRERAPGRQAAARRHAAPPFRGCDLILFGQIGVGLENISFCLSLFVVFVLFIDLSFFFMIFEKLLSSMATRGGFTKAELVSIRKEGGLTTQTRYYGQSGLPLHSLATKRIGC